MRRLNRTCGHAMIMKRTVYAGLNQLVNYLYIPNSACRNEEARDSVPNGVGLNQSIRLFYEGHLATSLGELRNQAKRLGVRKLERGTAGW
jgi:hypothetical protein